MKQQENRNNGETETHTSENSSPEGKEPDVIPVDPRRITLLGTGMGSEDHLTYEGIRACQEADVIIGSKRMLAPLKVFGKALYESVKPEEILQYIHKHPEYHRVVVAFSGDIGFYSGARKLYEGLAPEKTEWICGISSVSYFCSRLQIPWEDVYNASVHGRDANLAAAIREHRKVFSLVGGEAPMRKVCRQLIDVGMGDLTLWVGQNLSYPDEVIWQGTVREYAEREYSGLNVVLFENPEAESYVVTHGIPDDEFVSETMPVLPEEIRAVALSKLRLARNSVVYDIGAGTGSISIEAARQAADGLVLAIDRSPQAVELIRRNARKFGVTNIEIIAGNAPEALKDLPEPTHAFIESGSGDLKEICDLLRMKNPGVRIVVNAGDMKMIPALSEYLELHKPLHTELVQMASARAEEMEAFRGMEEQEPVIIAAFDDAE